jgi:hypothetical protein
MIKSSGNSSNQAGGKKSSLDPVEDFVNMENELAGDICLMVDLSLSSLKKVIYV